MPRSLQLYLHDIQQALSAIASYLDGKAPADYAASRQLRSAVEREFMIVGEAMSKMIHRFPESRDRLDHARRITGFRHLLVHEYFDIDDDLVWDIAINSAPRLLRQINAWIGELSGSDGASQPEIS